MRKAVCPENMQELCPPNAEKPEETEEVEEGEVSDRVGNDNLDCFNNLFQCFRP